MGKTGHIVSNDTTEQHSRYIAVPDDWNLLDAPRCRPIAFVRTSCFVTSDRVDDIGIGIFRLGDKHGNNSIVSKKMVAFVSTTPLCVLI